MRKQGLILLSLLLMGCQAKTPEAISEESTMESTVLQEQSQELFFSESDIKQEEFSIESKYCRNRTTPTNQFYIDDENVLWGKGLNSYGQLGMERDKDLEYHVEPVKIAENVISVDASQNGYFVIYQTGDNKLYGMGSNRLGLLGQPYVECYQDQDYDVVVEPVLLMDEVAYASAGRDSIMVLKQDGTVWWWGEYRFTSATKYDPYRGMNSYWKSEEDETNPAKILYNSPKMILEDCIYAVNGEFHGAAITSKGELYTWGLNIFGDCGVAISDDDYVRVPTKVLDGVDMVWVERMDERGATYNTSNYQNCYDNNIFARLKDGTILAAGVDLGNKHKTIELTGDLEEESTERYSDQFVSIKTMEYTDDYCQACMNELQTGMTMQEVIDFLQKSNIEFNEILAPVEGTDELVSTMIVANYEEYTLYFDENKCLYKIEKMNK